MNKTDLKRPNWLPSKWPSCLPYPSSWLRTLSIIPFVPVGAPSSFLLMLMTAMLIDDAVDKKFGALAVLLIFLVLLICAFIYALCHHTVIRKLKGKPTLLSQWKGIYAMITLNVALVPFWILSFFFNEKVYYYSRNYGKIIETIKTRDEAAQIAILSFLAISASMFQFEFVRLNRWLKKREKRLKKKQEREAITKEMEEMKAEIDKKRKERIAKCKRKTLVSQNKKRKK